jgi:ATP-dependent phosphoenolpyruvate carboxykinase
VDIVEKRMADDRLLVRNAKIHNIIVQLRTNEPHLDYFWKINWYRAPGSARPRVVIRSATGIPQHKPYAYYNSALKQAVFVNTNYYGQCKSWALGAVADYLETKQGVHSIHGACVDVDGEGVVIIAPTGTGKSTHSYGMLSLFKEARFHSDDWIYVTYRGNKAVADISERYFYMRTDGVDKFPKLRKIFDESPTENVKETRGRRVYKGTPNSRVMVNPRRFGKICMRTQLNHVILLRRNDKSPCEVKLTPEQAIEILKVGAYKVLPGAGPKEFWGKMNYEPWYNPYLLVRNKERTHMQVKFFKKLFKVADCYILNTGPEGIPKTRERIRAIVSGEDRHYVRNMDGYLVPKKDLRK